MRNTLKLLQTWWVQALRISSDESDTEPEGVYWHTRTRIGAIAPVDYNTLTQGIEVSEAHSTITES